MQPSLPENKPLQAVDSPLMTPTQSQGGVSNVPTPGISAGTSSDSPQHVAEQVKRLTEQYGQDPFKLSSMFGEIKGQHLAEHYHVTPNSVEG